MNRDLNSILDIVLGLLLGWFIFSGTPCKAEPNDQSLHIATAYGLTLTGAYAFRQLGMSNIDAPVTAFLVYNLGALVIEGLKDKFDGRNIAASVGGSAIGTLVFMTFDFND